MDTRCGFVWVREVNALCRAHGRVQLGVCAHGRVRRAAAHSHTGFDQAQRARTARHHMARSDQLLNQGFGQNHHIAGRTAQQFVAHHADRAEGALDEAAGGLFEFGLNALDHGCGCAATQYMHVVLS